MARIRSTRFRTAEVEFIYYDIHPEELWAPGHIVYDWCAEIGAELKAESKVFCPPGHSEARWPRTGTGNLLRSIFARGNRVAPQAYSLNYGADAPYAEFVHGGTAFQRGGYIYSNRGWANKGFIDNLFLHGHVRVEGDEPYPILPIPGGLYMNLGHSPYGPPRQLRVRGQRANPFLVKAWRSVHRRHEGLPTDLQMTFGPYVSGK